MKIKISINLFLDLDDIIKNFMMNPVKLIKEKVTITIEKITDINKSQNNCGECRPDLPHSTCPGCGKEQ